MEPLSKVQFGPFVIDVRERMLRRDGQPVALTPKAFDLLSALVEQPGRLASKDELLRKVWPDTFVEEANLAYNVFALRKALGDTAEQARYIETVPKSGYRFVAAVTPVPAGNDEPEAAIDDRTAGSSPAEGPRPAAGSSFTRRWIVIAPAAIVVVAAVAVYFAAPSWRAQPASVPASAVPLTSLAGGVRAPSLSPDGKHVVFTWTGPRHDNPDLYVQQIGAGSPLRLTHDPGNDFGASWSPDGRTIAFFRRSPAGGTSEVRLIAPLGGHERHLADTQPRLASYRPLSLAWCPDSSCVVATDAPGQGQPDALFRIDLATGERRQLTHPEGLTLDADPAISPDGRVLVFRRDTTPFTGAFYRLALRGSAVPDGDPVRVSSTLSAGKPVWMPDGREILFAARGGLWRLDVTPGGAPTRLPFVGLDGQDPVVSRAADGQQRLVYARSFADGNVWRVEATPGDPASSPPKAAIASTRNEFAPNVSADGTRIAFASDRSGELEIWVAAPDGSNAAQLTSLGLIPGYPRWSPDGKRAAFHADPEGRPAVLLVAAGGGKADTLTNDAADGAFPSFSRDGRWIYFSSLRTGEPRIWKAPVTGGAAVQVTPNAGTIAIESHDGRDLYYLAAMDRPSALWRLPVEGGTPVKVLDGVVLGNFDVAERGIYYIDRVTGDAAAVFTDRPAGETRLRYFDFANRAVDHRGVQPRKHPVWLEHKP